MGHRGTSSNFARKSFKTQRFAVLVEEPRVPKGAKNKPSCICRESLR